MRLALVALLVLAPAAFPVAESAAPLGIAVNYVGIAGQDGNVGPCTVTFTFARLPDAAVWQMVVTHTASGCIPALPNGGVGEVTLDGATGSLEQGFVSADGTIVISPPSSQTIVGGAVSVGKAAADWNGRDFTLTFVAV
jgi:hypothetical protein